MYQRFLHALASVLLLMLAAPVSAAARVLASGTFTARVDFSTLTATPVGNNCRLTVNGTLEFRGTLVGEVSGTTTALVFAPCSEVAENPPGTFRDIFRFTSAPETPFTGSVEGVPTTATLRYQGRTAAGGAIDGLFVLRGGVHAVLDVSATVAVGGSYTGVITR